MTQAQQIIEDRVNGTGVTEATVVVQGSDQLVVSIPGSTNTDVAKLGAAARAELARAGAHAGPVPLNAGGRRRRTSSSSAAPSTGTQQLADSARPHRRTAAASVGEYSAHAARRRAGGGHGRHRAAQYPGGQLPGASSAPAAPHRHRRPPSAPARVNGPARRPRASRSRPSRHRSSPHCSRRSSRRCSAALTRTDCSLTNTQSDKAAVLRRLRRLEQRQGHRRVPARPRDRAGHRDRHRGRAVAQRHAGTDRVDGRADLQERR